MTGRFLRGGPSLRGWSHQQEIQVCPQKWAFRHLLSPGIRVPAPPLIRGALVHTGCGQHMAARITPGESWATPAEAIREEAEREDAALLDAGTMALWGAHVDLAMRAVERFVQDDPLGFLRPVAAEHEVRMWVGWDETKRRPWLVPPPTDAEGRLQAARDARWLDLARMGPPYLTTFRLDMLGQGPDGRMVVDDYKTGWRWDVNKARGYTVSNQFLQFILWGMLAYERWGGAHVLFIDFRAVEANATSVFRRYAVNPPVDLVMRAPWAVWDRGEMLRQLAESDRDPANYPRALREQGPCVDRYGTCDFWSRCTGVDD